MTDFKQAIIVREDIGMSRGKMVAQACHASLGVYRKTPETQRQRWEEQGAKKIVLEAGDTDLIEIHEQAKSNGVPSYLVQDAGMTELEPGTKTAVGIGPAEEDKIDNITGELRLVE